MWNQFIHDARYQNPMLFKFRRRSVRGTVLSNASALSGCLATTLTYLFYLWFRQSPKILLLLYIVLRGQVSPFEEPRTMSCITTLCVCPLFLLPESTVSWIPSASVALVPFSTASLARQAAVWTLLEFLLPLCDAEKKNDKPLWLKMMRMKRSSFCSSFQK